MSEILSIEVPSLESLPVQPKLIVYGAGEFLDREPPEAQWLIPGLIPLGVPTVLASKGGLGKSMLMLQFSIALATGKSILGFDAGEPKAAIYFGLEDSKDTFHRRVRNIVRAYREAGEWSKADDEAMRRNWACPFVNWACPTATTYLPDLMPQLENIIQINERHGIPPGLMVIDTLARVSEGDENTVTALRPVLNACGRIAQHGYTPAMLHHVAKGQDGARNAKQKPTLAERMSTEWVRGSSAIVDNFRCILQFAAIREDEAEGAGLDADKARGNGYLVFGVTKANVGQTGDWKFLEQTDYGAWVTPRDGVEKLAKLRGRKALTDLKAKDGLLLELWAAQRQGMEPDRLRLSEQFCKGAKDPAHALRIQIGKLRKDGLVFRTGYQLTIQGKDRVETLTEETRSTWSVDND